MLITDFKKFKQNEERRLSAQPHIVRNLSWKILALVDQVDSKEFSLGFFLQCKPESKSK